MEVKILTAMGGADFSYGAGETVDVPEKKAKALIKSGSAEAVAKDRSSAPSQSGKAAKRPSQ